MRHTYLLQIVSPTGNTLDIAKRSTFEKAESQGRDLLAAIGNYPTSRDVSVQVVDDAGDVTPIYRD